MTIHVQSFDFDGCLFNSEYITSQDKDVIQANRKFLDSIKKKNTESSYSKSIVFVGSNRQSKATDDANLWLKGSCFPAIKDVSDYLGAELDTMLLADIYGNLPDGSAFAQALKDPEGNEKHAEWLFDETKATILYAQMHKIAVAHPNENIVFDFYDDLDGVIIRALTKFYTINSQLIPQNLTLRLSHYAGEEVTLMSTINGKGFIDSNYRQTVKDMAAQASSCEGKDGIAKKIHTALYVKPELLGNRTPLVTQTGQKKQTGEIPEELKRQLATLKRKAKALKKDGYQEAATTANTLHTTLCNATQKYFDGTLRQEAFAEACEKAIEEARPELETHRGWTECLANLALVLFGVIGLVIKGCINLSQNRPFLFFSRTESIKIVDQIEVTLEQVTSDHSFVVH